MDRQALYAVLDRFLAALRIGKADDVNWAAGALVSENNVMLAIGDGVWGTIQGLGAYDLRFADARTGQVGFFGTVIFLQFRRMEICALRRSLTEQCQHRGQLIQTVDADLRRAKLRVPVDGEHGIRLIVNAQSSGS